MTRRTIHVACGQIVCKVGDIEHNLRQIEDLSVAAAAGGARIALFAETAITSGLYTKEIVDKAIDPDGEEAGLLRKVAADNDIVIAAGAISRDAGGPRVSHFVAFPDGKLIVQLKHRLTPKETGVGLVPGPAERTIFEVDGVKFAVAICADSGIPGLWNTLAERGCQVYLGPSAGGAGREFMCHKADLEDPRKRAAYLASMEKVCFVGGTIDRCIRHRMAKMAVNLSGDDGVGNYHPGHSSIIDAEGRLIGLVPGEYVVEHLRPRLIHGEIVVLKPRRSGE